MSFTLCTSGAIIIEAGANASSTAIASAAILEHYSNQAEGFIAEQTGVDWVTEFSGVKTNFKPALAEACANWAAKGIIKYDMSGYNGRGEAESMINLNHDAAIRVIDDLKKESSKRKKMGIDK